MLFDDFFAKLCAQFLLNVTLWIVRQSAGSRYALELVRIVREGVQHFEPGHTFRSARGACARVYASSILEIICLLIFGTMTYEAYRCMASFSSTVARIGDLITVRLWVAVPLTLVVLAVIAATLHAAVVAQRSAPSERTTNA